MTQDKISALLGRPLSSVEVTNFTTFLELAQSKVSDILCANICQEVDTKRFPARNGYKTLNVPIFTEIDSVTLDGTATEKYTVRQGNRLNGDWFNSLVFDVPLHCQVVEIKADWGFSKTPIDVQVLVAQFFGMATDTLDGELVQSKQVEDFRITLKDKTKTEVFATKYAATIAKYSSCVQGEIEHGNVYPHFALEDGGYYARRILDI